MLLVSCARDRFLDGIAYQEAVQYAMDNTDSRETLIISTADHGHSITYNGYCGRGSPVTGVCMTVDKTATEHTGVPNIAADGLPYSVISVGNGPGSVLYVSTSPKEEIAVRVRSSSPGCHAKMGKDVSIIRCPSASRIVLTPSSR